MVKVVGSDIEIVYDWTPFFEPLPRFLILTLGLFLSTLAVALAGTTHFNGQPSPTGHRDLYAFCAILLAAGLFLTWHTLRFQPYHLCSAFINRCGIRLRWKRTNGVTSSTTTDEQFFGWDAMAMVQWSEEGQEHEFKQYLAVTLKSPALNRKKRFKFLVCDTRSPRECLALHALIPGHASRPDTVLHTLHPH